MKPTKNAEQAGANAPANDKAPDAANARGPKNTTNYLSDFRRAVTQVQGKRVSNALVVDLDLHPAKQMRELFPNAGLKQALYTAEAVGSRFIVAGGSLMQSNTGALSVLLARGCEVGALESAALAINAELSALSDATAWAFLVCADLRVAISNALEATQS